MLGNFLSRLIARYLTVVISGSQACCPVRPRFEAWTFGYIHVTLDEAEVAEECLWCLLARPS